MLHSGCSYGHDPTKLELLVTLLPLDVTLGLPLRLSHIQLFQDCPIQYLPHHPAPWAGAHCSDASLKSNSHRAMALPAQRAVSPVPGPAECVPSAGTAAMGGYPQHGGWDPCSKGPVPDGHNTAEIPDFNVFIMAVPFPNVLFVLVEPFPPL